MAGSWDSLPSACLHGVLGALDYRDVASNLRVSKHWAEAAQAEPLWQRLLEAQYGCSSAAGCSRCVRRPWPPELGLC